MDWHTIHCSPKLLLGTFTSGGSSSPGFSIRMASGKLSGLTNRAIAWSSFFNFAAVSSVIMPSFCPNARPQRQ